MYEDGVFVMDIRSATGLSDTVLFRELKARGVKLRDHKRHGMGVP